MFAAQSEPSLRNSSRKRTYYKPTLETLGERVFPAVTVQTLSEGSLELFTPFHDSLFLFSDIVVSNGQVGAVTNVTIDEELIPVFYEGPVEGGVFTSTILPNFLTSSEAWVTGVSSDLISAIIIDSPNAVGWEAGVVKRSDLTTMIPAGFANTSGHFDLSSAAIFASTGLVGGDSDGALVAAYWDEENGMQGIPSPFDIEQLIDGAETNEVFVGGSSGPHETQATMYTRFGPTLLEDPNGLISQALSISPDGSVIGGFIGSFNSSTFITEPHAALWNPDDASLSLIRDAVGEPVVGEVYDITDNGYVLIAQVTGSSSALQIDSLIWHPDFVEPIRWYDWIVQQNNGFAPAGLTEDSYAVAMAENPDTGNLVFLASGSVAYVHVPVGNGGDEEPEPEPTILGTNANDRLSLTITQDEFISTLAGNDRVSLRIVEDNVNVRIDLGAGRNNVRVLITANNVNLRINGSDSDDVVSIQVRNSTGSTIVADLGNGNNRFTAQLLRSGDSQIGVETGNGNDVATLYVIGSDNVTFAAGLGDGNDRVRTLHSSSNDGRVFLDLGEDDNNYRGIYSRSHGNQAVVQTGSGDNRLNLLLIRANQFSGEIIAGTEQTVLTQRVLGSSGVMINRHDDTPLDVEIPMDVLDDLFKRI